MVTQRGGRPAAPRRPGTSRGVLLGAAEAARVREARRLRRRRRRMTAVWVVVALVAGFASFTGGLLSAPVDFTDPLPPKSALLLDESGRVFASIRAPEVREDVPGSTIPQVMKDAVIAAEDQTFLEHRGVDPLAIARAAVKDVTGAPLQGGSTITQQYVKNVYTERQRTIMRKVREAALAVRLEQQLSKEEILTRYLNSTYFGNGTYGVQAASKYYFGVPVADLDLDEQRGRRDPAIALGRAAMLAGVIPAPSVWNPVRDMRQARSRQLGVLNAMVEQGKITSQQASDAYGRQPPRIVQASRPDTPTVAPEFRDYVRTRLGTIFDEDELFRGGLRVTTTLDLDLQKAMVNAVKKVLPDRDDPQAAVVAIDPRSGEIKAMTTKVNRKGQHRYRTGDFNLATQATRSTGSTIKPFTLATALQRGRSVSDPVCAPGVARVPNPGGEPDPYLIHNAEGSGGCYTLGSALQRSVNTVYGPLALEVGLRRVLRGAVAAGLAPASKVLRPLVPAKSIGGGLDVTPISEAVAFSTLANHGVRNDPRSILTVRSGGAGGPNAGEVVYRANPPRGKRVMPARVADQVVDVLYGTVSGGTATRARQPFPVFGKTGTTNNSTDAWFVGCTRKLCIATWMGYDKLRPMYDVQGVSQVYGGTLPAEIFAQTWEEYRRIQEAERNPGKVSAPTPSAGPQVRRTVRPEPTRTRVTESPRPPRPKPTRTQEPVEPTPRPEPTSAEPTPPIIGGPSP